VRNTALRLLEAFAKYDETTIPELEKQVLILAQDSNPLIALQCALTAGSLSSSTKIPLLISMVERYSEMPVMRDAIMSSLYQSEFEMLKSIWNKREWKKNESGKAIFIEMLTAAVLKGEGNEAIPKLESLIKQPTQLGQWATQSVQTAIGISKKQAEQQQVAGQEKKSTIDPKLYATGRQQYLNVCSGCHGNNGEGMNRFAPPLVNSEWVTGDEQRLAVILLHGMEGPVTVADKNYNAPEILPAMPSLSTMDNGNLAAIMSYIRNEWGHEAPPVKSSTVGFIRYRTQGKIKPWTEEELLAFSLEGIE